MMGLRLLEGLRPEPFRAATGLDLREAFEPDRIARLINGGFIEHDAAGLRCTAEGRLRLNAILETLLT
jgi:coproporphyrinogen III oxidase-like Fe-S oxidoreductase